MRVTALGGTFVGLSARTVTPTGELGMHTLRQDGIQKAAKGVTTIEEVLAATAAD